MVFCHSKLQWHGDIKIKGGLFSFYLTYVIPNDTMYLRFLNPRLFRYTWWCTGSKTWRENAMWTVKLKKWIYSAEFMTQAYQHDFTLGFNVWTISCIQRILTLNMSMSVAFLCNFTILPQNKLKHTNMKLPYHTTTSHNVYSTCRLSSQLDNGWAGKRVGMK